MATETRLSSHPALEHRVCCIGRKRHWHELAEADVSEVLLVHLVEDAPTERAALALSLAKCRKIWPFYSWSVAPADVSANTPQRCARAS